ncbi:hypothetical protein EC991_003788 [Linnemannia zychae]|nr:hypothetical protein EC991_003788 [Linnemannia zychae]
MVTEASPPSHQSFRLKGSSSADEVRIVIRYNPASRQRFVLWNDILNVFRSAGHVQHGNDVLPYMTDNQFDLRPLRVEACPGVVLEVVTVPLSGQETPSPTVSQESIQREYEDPSPEEPLQSVRTNSQRTFAEGIMRRGLDTSMPPSYEITVSTPPPSQRTSASSTSRSGVGVSQRRISTALNTTPLITAAAEAAAETWSLPDDEPTLITSRGGGRMSRASQQFVSRVQSLLLDSSHQLQVYGQSIISEPSARNDFLVRGVATIQHGLNSIHQELHDVVPTLRAEISKNTILQHQILEMQTAAEEMARRMLEMQQQAVKLQEQTLDRLATIQSRVTAILTQTYELHEYPIPRLFIILPKEDVTRSESFRNVFSKQFKLYFLCECNHHSHNGAVAAPKGSGVVSSGQSTAMQRQEIHIARHEGYDLDRPTEFFEKYGSYVLTLLQMLKYGAVVAGVVVPPLAQLRIADGLDTAKQSADALYKAMEPKVDSAIEYLQSLSGNQGSSTAAAATAHTSSVYGEGLEALEGANLRQLSSFLKIKDEGRVLGNLYRMVTKEGHVKWVCLDHYRETYGLSAQRELKEVVEMSRGRYDEPTGTITVELVSPMQAKQFYSILSSSRFVQELRLTMSWDTTLEDYRNLKDALQQSNVIRLELTGNMTSGPKTDILNRSRRHDPVLQLMAGGKLKILVINGLKNFLERTSKVPSIIHIRSFELRSSTVTSKDRPHLEKFVQASPMLYELTLLVQDIDATSMHLSPLLKKLRRFRILTLHQNPRTTVTFQYDPATDGAPLISLTGDGIESTKLAVMQRVRILYVQKYQEPQQIQELVKCIIRTSSSLEIVEIRCLADHFPTVTGWIRKEVRGHKSLHRLVLSDGFNSVVIRDFQNNTSALPTSELELQEISTCESDDPAQDLTALFEKHGSEIKVLDLDHNFTHLQAFNFLQSVRQAQGSKLRILTWDITKTWDGRIFRDMLPALRMCDPTVLQWVAVKINQGYKYIQQPGIVTILDDQSSRESLGMILRKKANRLELRARGLNVIMSKLQTACNGPFEQLEELYIRGFEERFGGRSVKWVQSLMQRDVSTRLTSSSLCNVQKTDIRPKSPSSSLNSDTKSNPNLPIPPAPMTVPVVKRLTSITLFHVHLAPHSWELFIRSIDYLTIRHLDFTLTNFADPELIHLTTRCLDKVLKCRSNLLLLPSEDTISPSSFSILGAEKRLELEDLKEQEKHGLMVWLDCTDVSHAVVVAQQMQIEENKCFWFKLGGIETVGAV